MTDVFAFESNNVLDSVKSLFKKVEVDIPESVINRS